MTSQDIPELIERVRAATGPDRELDALLHAIVADQRTVRENMHPEFGRQLLARHSRPPHDEYWLNHPATVFPAYTASIDAVLALAERARPGSWRLLLMKALHDINKAPDILDMSHMPRLILLALLTALQSTHSGQMK